MSMLIISCNPDGLLVTYDEILAISGAAYFSCTSFSLLRLCTREKTSAQLSPEKSYEMGKLKGKFMVVQFVQMIEELKKCEKAGATTACLMQIYVYIDTLAYFGLPVTKNKNTRSDFIKWVDKYLKANKEQNYQYRGKDVYGARCALLHTFSSETDYHTQNQDIIKFGYHDGGRHAYNPQVDSTLVIIGVASFVNDFVIAVTNFLQDIKKRVADENERDILQARLNKILNTVSFPSFESGKAKEVA